MPKFPYRRTVRDDLTELWRLERRRSVARPAGLTSISAAEGSLDLIDDTGATIARYGDMPGDKFGIGIPHGGGWVTVQEYMGIRLQPLTIRMGEAEGRLDAHESRLDTHSDHLGLHDTQIWNINGRLNGHDSDISTLEGLLSDLGDQINDIAGDNSNAQETLGELSDAISTLAGNLAVANGRIIILSTIIRNIADRVDALDNGSTSPTPPIWA